MRGAFEVIYTGLKRYLGSPQDYSKNKAENRFPQNFDLSIPVEETNQKRAVTGPSDGADAESDLDNVDLRSSEPVNLQQKRVSANPPNSIQQFMGDRLESSKKLPVFDDEKGYMPLAAMNNFTQDWVICVKVNHINYKRWSNAKGEGTLLNLDLMDESGTQIQGTFFKDQADKFKDIIETGKVYEISGG